MKKVRSVISDYVDDNNYRHIDCYFSDDENEAGKTVAIICLDTSKVYFIDNMYRGDELVKEEIENIQREINGVDSDDIEIKNAILEMIRDEETKEAWLGYFKGTTLRYNQDKTMAIDINNPKIRILLR